MTYSESRKPVLTDKGIQNKAPEHRKNALKGKYQETLRSPITPIKEIRTLTLNMILEINKQIKDMSIKEPYIQYENKDDPVLMRKLEKLVEYTPNLEILEIAAYYLKNIILLQAFPDANHRTALTAVKIFLEMNDWSFDHTDDEALNFQEECHDCRIATYGTCNEMSTSVLRENNDSLFLLCLEFVKQHAAISI